MPNGNAIEWSHGRPRSTVRADGVPPLLSAKRAEAGRKGAAARWHPEPSVDGTGSDQSGNSGSNAARGIATLNPAAVPAWMRGPAEQGRTYIAALLAVLVGKEPLHPLAGDCVDAHVMYRATLALGVKTKNTKRRAALMSEARGWLREHRTVLATLSVLAGGMKLPEPDDGAAPWLTRKAGA